MDSGAFFYCSLLNFMALELSSLVCYMLNAWPHSALALGMCPCLSL